MYLLSAICGIPPSPNNGFVDFTDIIEGSEATFRCESGPEMTAVCTASGEWVPNPGDLSCSQPPGQGDYDCMQCLMNMLTVEDSFYINLLSAISQLTVESLQVLAMGL